MSPESRWIRPITPKRWQAAAQRAIDERVEVRQLNESGAWIASSGTDPVMCYLLEVRMGIVVRCTCPAGAHGDPCCKHAARFYLDRSLLEVISGEPVRLLEGSAG